MVKKKPSPGKRCFPRIILYPRYKSASSQELSIFNLPFMIKETQLCTFRPIVFISLNKKLVNSHDKICYSLYAVNNYLRYLHLINDCACKAFCTCNNFKDNYVSKQHAFNFIASSQENKLMVQVDGKSLASEDDRIDVLHYFYFLFPALCQYYKHCVYRLKSLQQCTTNDKNKIYIRYTYDDKA